MLAVWITSASVTGLSEPGRMDGLFSIGISVSPCRWSGQTGAEDRVGGGRPAPVGGQRRAGTAVGGDQGRAVAIAALVEVAAHEGAERRAQRERLLGCVGGEPRGRAGLELHLDGGEAGGREVALADFDRDRRRVVGWARVVDRV